MITGDDIKTLERLDREATPAPWIIAHDALKQPAVVDSQRRVILNDAITSDLELAAAARNAITGLLAFVAATHARELELRNELKRWRDRHGNGDAMEQDAKLAKLAPLVDAVRAWVKHRYAPRLLAAWEAYNRE